MCPVCARFLYFLWLALGAQPVFGVSLFFFLSFLWLRRHAKSDRQEKTAMASAS